MATIVLTAVGAVVGGPVGAAIGAIAGQQIDNALFAPKARHGPRLGDLSVQTSAYGAAIPKIFGTMRVAGTVIWATDLKEERSRSGGGKGKAATVSYSYSASFAVALSARPIRGIGRIWADGKLLRGSAGDFKVQTELRLHLGSEDQAPDPLIAAAEGAGRAPAHRGIAYAVFQDLQLADYGNRIPSLSFEVVADEGPVGIGEIAAGISDGLVAGPSLVELGGYAASGSSIRAAIEALADVVPLSLAEGGGGLALRMVPEPLHVIAGDAEGAHDGNGARGRSEFTRRSALSTAGDISIAYLDPARDYQPGLQRARRGGAGQLADRRALPAAISSDGAKALAELRLGHVWASRESGAVHLGSRHIAVRPGSAVRLAGRAGTWRVSRWTLEAMIVRLELVRVPAPNAELPLADSGRPMQETDAVHGPTTLLLLELPHLGDDIAHRTQLAAMAAGASPGWRRAALSASFDGGASWTSIGATAAPAIIGKAITALPAAESALLDLRSSVEVELLNDDMWLEGRSDAALIAGSNLVVVGDELIQFGRAEPLGARRFRLSRLLRGRRGTEWAASAHAPGESFALLQPDAVTMIEPPSGMTGGSVRVMAEGVGEGQATSITARQLEGRSLEPPSPVHLRARRSGSGDVHVSWVRRSRAGWRWDAGSEAPLGEERELYRIRMTGAGFERSLMREEPNFHYLTAMQVADGAAGPLLIQVVQVGTHAASRPATLLLP